MRSYTVESILAEFPNARSILRYEMEEPELPRKFVSVFDRWLGAENYHLLDCKDDLEREDRNKKLLAHWTLVIERTSVWTMEENQILEVVDRQQFLQKCGDYEKSGDEFAFVLLPELGAYYLEDWDDTNVVWYVDEDRVQPLFDWAAECGLFTLPDWKAETSANDS